MVTYDQNSLGFSVLVKEKLSKVRENIGNMQHLLIFDEIHFRFMGTLINETANFGILKTPKKTININLFN